jgi:hypothetical protein
MAAMSEPRLRRELLSITADQWGQILEACPAVGHELRPVVRRRPGSRHEVDGRWVKRWVDQPQQHRGQLEGAVRRWTLSLLHWTDNGLDLPATSEAWAEAVHGVSMRDGRAPAMLCRAYARSLGYAIEVGKGGNAQLEEVATPLAAAPKVANSTPEPPDSEPEPDDAAVPGGDHAEALTKAQEIADVLAHHS